MCSEAEARNKLVDAYFPNVDWTPEERTLLGGILLEINIRETKLKQLATDLRTIAETLRYCARNMNLGKKQRDALNRVIEHAKVATS